MQKVNLCDAQGFVTCCLMWVALIEAQGFVVVCYLMSELGLKHKVHTCEAQGFFCLMRVTLITSSILVSPMFGFLVFALEMVAEMHTLLSARCRTVFLRFLARSGMP